MGWEPIEKTILKPCKLWNELPSATGQKPHKQREAWTWWAWSPSLEWCATSQQQKTFDGVYEAMLMSNMYDTSMFLVAQSVLSWQRWCSDSYYSCQKLTVEGTWRYLCDSAGWMQMHARISSSALSTKDRTDLRWCPTHEGSKLSNCPETMGEQEFWATRKVKEKHTLAVVRYSVCDLFFPCEESIWSRQGEFGIRGHHLHDFWRFLRCPCSDLCGASQHEAFVRIFEVLVDTFWQVGFLKTKIWGTCGICVYT